MEDLLPHKKWPKIPRLEDLSCLITEKLDGMNAIIGIDKNGNIKPGNRNGWITPDNDNHGFAQFVYDNADELLKLGPGYHYGEWVGRGINRKYNKTDRALYLFNEYKYHDLENLPDGVKFVPLIDMFSLGDEFSFDRILESIEQFTTTCNGKSLLDLKTPCEGVIIQFIGTDTKIKIIWNK